MKYTRLQELAIAEAEAVHKELVNKRATMRAEIEREYESQLAALRLQQGLLVAKGVRAGVSKTRMGRAVGTTDWKTIQELLEMGERSLPAEEVYRERFSWGVIALKRGKSFAGWILDDENPDRITSGETLQGRVENRGWYVMLGIQNEVPAEVEAWAMEHYTELPDSEVAETPEPEYSEVHPVDEEYDWIPVEGTDLG